MRINRYKLKESITPDDIRTAAEAAGWRYMTGGTWICDGVTYYIHNSVDAIDGGIEIEIGFPKDIRSWNDDDFVFVLDDEFCQPFTPFYKKLADDSLSYPFLDSFVKEYNKLMDGIRIFERRDADITGDIGA